MTTTRSARHAVGVALLCTGPFAATGQAAQGGPDYPGIKAVLHEAVNLLVASQEIYLDDPLVGILSPTELALYQAREEARLERIRTWCAGFAVEWPYEGVYRVGPTRVIPSGYRVGGTAIVGSALVQAPGYAVDPGRQGAVNRSIGFILDMLATDPSMGPGPAIGYDVRGWGHAYALQFLLESMDAGVVTDPAQVVLVNSAIQELVSALEINVTVEGGWNYANQVRMSPFMTGPTLVALYLARARGYAVDGALVDLSIDALESARTPLGSYPYSGASPVSTPMPGSSARSCAAELALHLAGRATDDHLRIAISGFVSSWEFLLERKSQQGTHVGPYGIAPYYFFFGHIYAALAIERLPAGERDAWRAQMRRLLWETREADGGWNDRVFPRSKSYGTAMSLMAITAPTRPALAEW